MKKTPKNKQHISNLSSAQKTELDKRMELLKSGQMEVFNWQDVYQELNSTKKPTSK